MCSDAECERYKNCGPGTEYVLLLNRNSLGRFGPTVRLVLHMSIKLPTGTHGRLRNVLFRRHWQL
jgi:hypothetical protein